MNKIFRLNLFLFSIIIFNVLHCDEIIKKDGSKISGHIIKETENSIIVDITGIEVRLDKSDIKEIKKITDATDPDEIQADFYTENNKFENALEIYEKLLTKYEDDKDIQRLETKIDATKKKIEERDLKKFATQLKVVDEKIKAGKLSEAELDLDAILNSIPEKNPSREKILEKKASLHFSKAKYYFDIVRNAEAEKELRAAINIYPKYAPAHIKYAEIMDKRGDIQSALTSYLKGLECGDDLLSDKEKSEFKYKVGMIFFKMGEYAQAIKSFEYLIDKKSDYYSESQEKIVESYVQLALLCLPGSPDKAIDFLKKGLSVNSKSKNLLFLLGKIYYDLNKFELALENFSNLKNIDTKFKDLHYYIGMCFNYLGEDAKAKASFEQEIVNNPQHFDSYCELGDYYFDGGDYDRAEKQFLKAKELYPEKFRAYLGLGKVFRLQRKNDAAIDNLKKVLEYAPNHPEANLNLGAIYKDQEKYDEAKKFFEQVIDKLKSSEKERKLTPKEIKLYVDALIKKGEIDIIVGQPRSAMDFFRDALKMQPNNADAFYNLGQAFTKLKDFKSAEAHYKKAISLNPNEARYFLGLGIIYQNDLKNLTSAIDCYKNYILKGGPDFVNVNMWIQECGGEPVEPPSGK